MTRNETKYMDSALALSEALHITKAARKLRISQPMLTKNIQELEDFLGGRLFERDCKTVSLNDAGRAYSEQAKLAIMYAERASQAARSVMENAETVLHVGRSPYADPYLVSTLQSIQLPLYSRLRLELSSQFSCDLIQDVIAGALDVVIATEPPESQHITKVKVSEAPFYIAMSKRDKLANEPLVTMEHLRNHCWILFERRLHPPLHDNIMRLAEEKNASPKKVRHITAPEEAFPYLDDGECVAFVVKAGALLLARNGVTVRPLNVPELTLRTYLASRSDNESKVVSEFVRAFMRKLLPIKIDLQRSLPLVMERFA